MDWLSFFQNIIPISAIVSAIVLPVVPLLLVPVLDYSISPPVQLGSSRTFISEITLTNVGIFSANNVTVSIIANNISINNLSSEPFLPNKTYSFTSQMLKSDGKGLFVADKLLSHATMTLHVTLNVPRAFENEKLTVYVQSDETVGYHGVKYVILSYITVALALAFISMSSMVGKIGQKVLYSIFIVGGVCVVLVTYFLYLVWSN